MNGLYWFPIWAGLLILGSVKAATFTVTTTNETGAGSLFEAITLANAGPGLDSIHFNIPGDAIHTGTPTIPLPDIIDPSGDRRIYPAGLPP